MKFGRPLPIDILDSSSYFSLYGAELVFGIPRDVKPKLK